MELAADEPGMILDFNDFDKAIVRRRARNHQASFAELRSVFIVEFPAVAMAFVNEVLAVYIEGLCVLFQLAGIYAQAHRTAFVGNIDLIRHEIDDGEGRVFIEFRGRSALEAADVAGKFHDGALHTEA